MLKQREKIGKVSSFQLFNDTIYYLNHNNQLFQGDLLLSDNIKSFKVFKDYIFTRDIKSYSQVYERNDREVVVYSSEDKKSFVFPDSYLCNKVFIVEFLKDEIADFNNLKYKLWDFTTKDFIKNFIINNSIFLDYQFFNNVLIIKLGKGRILVVNMSLPTIMNEINMDSRIRNLLGVQENILHIVTESDGELFLNEIDVITGKTISKINSIIDSNSNYKVNYSNSFSSALLIREKNKIVAFTSDNYWELDLKSREFSVLQLNKKSKSKKIFCNGVGIRNYENFLFGISQFIEKRNGLDYRQYKIFSFDINTKEITWEQRISLPGNFRLFPDSLQVNEYFLAIKDDENNLHVFERDKAS